MNLSLAVTSELELTSQEMLWLVLFIPIALLATRFLQKQDAFRLGCSHLIPADVASWRTRFHRAPLLMAILAVVCLIVVMARPERVETLTARHRGIDILLVVDVSSSMNEEDMAVAQSRLAVAKDAARGFIVNRTDDRIGLVAFARHADLIAPPTRDHDAVLQLLDSLQTKDASGGEDATAIGAAVAVAGETLAERTGSAQIVVVLTDGEENVASIRAKGEIAPIHAGQFCRAMDVRVYTIAAGSGRRGSDGSLVPLDTSALQSLAKTTGGTFFEARDAVGAARVYEAINESERTELEQPRVQRASIHERFLQMALLLFAASVVLRWTVLRVRP